MRQYSISPTVVVFDNKCVTGAGSATTPIIQYPEMGKYALSTNGFMVFSLTVQSMLVQILNENGKLLYNTTITK